MCTLKELMSETEYNGIPVKYDTDIIDPDSFTARRPYYRIRGPKVTEQQAFEIIRKTDRVFRISLDEHKYREHGYIDTINFGNLFFNKNYCDSPQGWCHPSGIIGENGITGTYPEIFDYIWDFTEFIKNFPFLDMIVAVTDWDEMPPYAWKRLFKYHSYFEHQDYRDFIENIKIGFWLHGGLLEVLNPTRAQQVYREYIGKYEEPDKSIYVPGYYNEHNIIPADFEYLKRLVAAYGFDPDQELKDFYWKDWLEGKPEKKSSSSGSGDTGGSGLCIIG